MGTELAKANMDLIVCSPFPDSADFHAVRAYSFQKNKGSVHFHYPMHNRVIKVKEELEVYLGKNCPKIIDWKYPAPLDEESWEQAWLLCQLQALDQAEVIVAIGGKVSKSANTLLHLAEAKGIIIIPFTFLGGAAKRSFDRINWDKLYPTVKSEILHSKNGIEEIVDLINQFKICTTNHLNIKISVDSTFFISRSKEDKKIGIQAGEFLRKKGVKVLLGDDAINENKMVLSSIEEYLNISDVCIILWSKFYALSPWCYDELLLATKRQNVGKMNILIFNLDKSLIVPKEGRGLNEFQVNSGEEILDILKKVLK